MSFIALVIFVFCVVCALGLGGLAAWCDVTGLRIPNIYPLLIAVLFVVAWAAAYGVETDIFAGFVSHMAAAALVFLVTFGLFAAGVLGGGDSKLAASYSLWAGMAGLPVFLVYMSIAGALVSLAALAIRHFKPFESVSGAGWIAQAQAGQAKVPYGVALFVGGVAVFFYNGYAMPTAFGAFLM